MAVPSFQTWFNPLLLAVQDGRDHSLSDLYDRLAAMLRLDESQRQEVLPSGKQTTYQNRIGWARTYLKKAGLVESPGRGLVRITPAGLEVVRSKATVNVKFLMQFPAFKAFHTYVPSAETQAGAAEESGSFEAQAKETPEELLEDAHRALKSALIEEVLDKVMAAPPRFFETLVVELLLKMGYGGSREEAGRTMGGSGDGGIDGVINEDRLGLDVVCIQAKRWEATVGRPVVQAFAGSLEGVRARKGVLITTSSFSSDAKAYVAQIEKRIVLIDGQHLAELMFEHNLGVTPIASYEVKRIDSDYFEEV